MHYTNAGHTKSLQISTSILTHKLSPLPLTSSMLTYSLFSLLYYLRDHEETVTWSKDVSPHGFHIQRLRELMPEELGYPVVKRQQLEPKCCFDSKRCFHLYCRPWCAAILLIWFYTCTCDRDIYIYITRSELASLAHSLRMSSQWTGKGRLCNKFTSHPGKPCDLFNLLAKKLVTRAAALLARTPGIRRLEQDRLPLGSTRGQFGIPEVALLSLSGRHRRVRFSISILFRTFLERAV